MQLHVKITQGLFLFAFLILFSCKTSNNNNAFTEESSGEPTEIIEYNNPPAEGFNFQESTPHAIVMADQIMNAMGGRQQWDDTKVISWNFLGFRTLLWDKEHNKVRIDAPGDKLVVALDMNDMTGKVWKNGEAIVKEDSVKEYLKWGKNVWINDSYWLFMPFKLKDSGVTLTYVREDTTLTGVRSDVLRLTFAGVGVTPQNAYEVWVDIKEKLIKQWAYYKDAKQEEPSFVKPWTDYQNYKGILLSGERGDRDITDIKVMNKVPKGAFEDPKPL